MARTKSSKQWLTEHFEDHYVKLARQQGLRSRSAFKLQEINEKSSLIRPGMIVVDLGAAPGGWCQVAGALLADSGRLIALDILPMERLEAVEFIQGDFREDGPLEALQQSLQGQPVDLVLSDMAPNMSGVTISDQASATYLAELALEFAASQLKLGGNFVVKLFQGEGFDAFVEQARRLFHKVQIQKPAASRPRSREVYVVARRLRVR